VENALDPDVLRREFGVPGEQSSNGQIGSLGVFREQIAGEK
jgi:hypothetical protein